MAGTNEVAYAGERYPVKTWRGMHDHARGEFRDAPRPVDAAAVIAIRDRAGIFGMVATRHRSVIKGREITTRRWDSSQLLAVLAFCEAFERRINRGQAK